MEANADDPLLVATGTDLAFFPGGGRPPTVESYRLSARGFKEIAAISHLGPAVATLARMREHDPAGPWRSGRGTPARRGRVRPDGAGSPELWDRIAVPAFVGRSESIAAMIDYACRPPSASWSGRWPTRAYLDAAATARPTTCRVPPTTCRCRSTASWSRRSSSPGWTSRTGS